MSATTEQEVATVSSDGGWPIRVGGVYRDTTSRSLERRVTAIAGDQVFYLFRLGGEDTNEANRLSPASFRRTSLPEDQSPIPALVEALEEVARLLTQPPPGGCDAQGALKVIAAALKLAEQGVTK